MKTTFLLGTAAVAATSVSGFRIYRLAGVDVVGNDITSERKANVYECLSMCVSNPACSAATWTNYNTGTCWIKSAGFKGTPSAPKAEADSYVLLDDSTSSFIWSGTKDGFDMAGFDIDNTGGKDMGACMNACNKNGNCFAVTWTNYQGGWCWLKSRASGYVAKAGAKVAYVAREGL